MKLRRKTALISLGAVAAAPEDPGWLPLLAAGLRSANAAEKDLCRKVWRDLGADPDDPLRFLLEGVMRPGAREAAVEAVPIAGARAAADLAAVRRHPDPQVREFAAQLAGDLSASARELVPVLEEMSRDPSPAVAEAAAEALRRIARASIGRR